MMKIPYGYCHCGCGQKTNLAPYTSSKHGWIKGEPLAFIRFHYAKLNRLPNGEHKWYRTTKTRRAKRYGWIYEHIAIVEKVLGKEMPPGAVIHHVDGDIHNNANNNLVVCQSHGYHRLLHTRMIALNECGHANYRKCCRCHEWDSQENLVINTMAYHQKCNARHTRLRWIRRKYGNQI